MGWGRPALLSVAILLDCAAILSWFSFFLYATHKCMCAHYERVVAFFIHVLFPFWEGKGIHCIKQKNNWKKSRRCLASVCYVHIVIPVWEATASWCHSSIPWLVQLVALFLSITHHLKAQRDFGNAKKKKNKEKDYRLSPFCQDFWDRLASTFSPIWYLNIFVKNRYPYFSVLWQLTVGMETLVLLKQKQKSIPAQIV